MSSIYGSYIHLNYLQMCPSERGFPAQSPTGTSERSQQRCSPGSQIAPEVLRGQYQSLRGGGEWMSSVLPCCDALGLFLPGNFAMEQHSGVYTDLQRAANSFQMLVVSSCPGKRGDRGDKLRPCCSGKHTSSSSRSGFLPSSLKDSMYHQGRDPLMEQSMSVPLGSS